MAIKVMLIANYDLSFLAKQLKSNRWQWDDINFSIDYDSDVNEIAECDFLIVINYPTKPIKIRCRKGGAWLFSQEPPDVSNKFHQKSYQYFDRVYQFDKDCKINSYGYQTALPWFVTKSYNQLINYNFDVSIKTKRLSWVTSNKNNFQGHRLRLAFLDKLRKSDVNFDLFGSGFELISNKEDALLPYKYSIAVENASIDDYWTEKIADCFLSYCMPLYFGATNICKYFPDGSYVWIDITNPQQAIKKIKQVIYSDLWLSNLEAIIKARELVLNKYQMFPHIEYLISNSQDICNNKIITYDIPKNVKPVGLVKTLKKIGAKFKLFFNRVVHE